MGLGALLSRSLITTILPLAAIAFAIYSILPSASNLDAYKAIIEDSVTFRQNLGYNIKHSGKKILFALPEKDFDPTEVVAPWSILSSYGIDVVFATDKGRPGVLEADKNILEAKHIDSITKTIFRLMNLIAQPAIVEQYRQLEMQPAFQNPLAFKDINVNDYAAVYIPGGHDQGVREVLESASLRKLLLQFYDKNKIMSALCHGVLALSRTKQEDGKSILYHRKVTGLTKFQENIAYLFTSWRVGNMFRTYPGTTVEDEVKQAIHDEENLKTVGQLERANKFFDQGPISIDKATFEEPFKLGYLVEDDNIITARWPGDAYALGHRIARRIFSQ